MCRYYIGYKTLKRRIKYYSGRAEAASGFTDDQRYEIVKSFSELLDSQVHFNSLGFWGMYSVFALQLLHPIDPSSQKSSHESCGFEFFTRNSFERESFGESAGGEDCIVSN